MMEQVEAEKESESLSFQLKMVTAMKEKKDGEEIKILSLEKRTRGKKIGTKFLFLEWPNTHNFITKIFTKKKIKK